jgi:hypothetical protein
VHGDISALASAGTERHLAGEQGWNALPGHTSRRSVRPASVAPGGVLTGLPRSIGRRPAKPWTACPSRAPLSSRAVRPPGQREAAWVRPGLPAGLAFPL